MKYMLLIYSDEQVWDDASLNKCYDESSQLAHRLKESGKLVATSPLHPVSTAMSVRVRQGERLVTDGPFAETREQLGGYYLIEAEDMDEAVEIAGQIPVANVGTVEIRPVLELSGLPEI